MGSWATNIDVQASSLGTWWLVVLLSEVGTAGAEQLLFLLLLTGGEEEAGTPGTWPYLYPGERGWKQEFRCVREGSAHEGAGEGEPRPIPVSGLKNQGAVCKEGKGFWGVQC